MEEIKLTNREFEVLEYLCAGLNNREIGKQLIISSHTSKAHVASLIRKFNAKNRVECAYLAAKYGLM